MDLCVQYVVVKCYSTQPVYFKFIPFVFLIAFPCTFLSLSHQRRCRVHDFFNPAVIGCIWLLLKLCFSPSSPFHSYSLLGFRNCSFSIGRVWIQDLTEAPVTTNHEELSFKLPFLGSKKNLHMSQLQLLWVGTRWNLESFGWFDAQTQTLIFT